MMNLKFKRKLDCQVGNLLLAAMYPFVRLAGKLLRKQHSLDQVRHVTFIKLLGGGSLTMVTPALLAMRESHQETHFNLICTPEVKAFANALGLFDSYSLVDDKNLLSLLISSLKTWWFLLRKAEATIDLELHSRLTTVLTLASLVHTRIGLIDHLSIWRRRLNTHSVYISPCTGIFKAYDSLSQIFSSELLSPSDLCQHFEKSYGSKLESNSRIVTVGVSCSNLSVERKLPEALWRDYLHEIAKGFGNENPIEFYFVGASQDRSLAESIIGLLDNSITYKNLCGDLSLKNSLKQVNQSLLYVGIDSGLLHFARLLKVPAIGFWGPTQPDHYLRKHYPSYPEIHFYLGLGCSPCVHILVSPICQGKNVCMNNLSLSTERRLKLSKFLSEIQNPDISKKLPLTSESSHQTLVMIPNGSFELF